MTTEQMLERVSMSMHDQLDGQFKKDDPFNTRNEMIKIVSNEIRIMMDNARSAEKKYDE